MKTRWDSPYRYRPNFNPILSHSIISYLPPMIEPLINVYFIVHSRLPRNNQDANAYNTVINLPSKKILDTPLRSSSAPTCLTRNTPSLHRPACTSNFNVPPNKILGKINFKNTPPKSYNLEIEIYLPSPVKTASMPSNRHNSHPPTPSPNLNCWVPHHPAVSGCVTSENTLPTHHNYPVAANDRKENGIDLMFSKWCSVNKYLPWGNY